MTDIFNNSWASIVNWVNDVIRQFEQYDLQLIDWETHGDKPELPNANLIGPLSLAVSEIEDGLHEVVFAVGVSTYVDDANLFKLREIIGYLYSNLLSQKQITYYDSSDAQERSVLVMTPGTTVEPKAVLQVRPFQYVQARALLVPEGILHE